MACAVTALPVLILLMESLEILRHPLCQRVLRYASLDDITIWGVLALILLDWTRVGRQVGFFVVFALISYFLPNHGLARRKRSVVFWTHLAHLLRLVCRLRGTALHGRCVLGRHCYGQSLVQPETYGPNALPRNADDHAGLLPEQGIEGQLEHGGQTVFIAAGALLVASVAGKLLGVSIAGKMLKWQ
jgi:hypothetical protein